ncbi:OLC1v1018179C1 [Oldenlandia corymbosa var. corymbosa]|uniref:DNA-directed RNA polymerase subunit n=1 Tax=Oldenlandia corymbosa var. corymbosa TaxID=529605 RepID=A0AAV1EB50_OLDCO|nr:OLC1v1018179C1 [Oldenlandia corymbosa var. corymbosa]
MYSGQVSSLKPRILPSDLLSFVQNPSKALNYGGGNFGKQQNTAELACCFRVESMEGLKPGPANFLVYIHPSKSKIISDAILVELNSLLFKFSETFDGVVLAYEPNVQSYLAMILPGLHPYLGVSIQSELLLFHPKPDMLVEGEVVKVTESSIHLIVLGFSSAIIMDSDIREEFCFDEEIIHISGSLLPAHTGCVKWLEKHVEELSQSKSNTKKRKAIKETGEVYAVDKVATDGGKVPVEV